MWRSSVDVTEPQLPGAVYLSETIEGLAGRTKSRVRASRYLIYGLLDPRDASLRYVGKTHMRREHRLERHVESALEGASAPVSQWIRELHGVGLDPVVFVIERIPGDADWREAEVNAIRRWHAWPESELPYVHPPQTPKSLPTKICHVSLLNVHGVRGLSGSENV